MFMNDLSIIVRHMRVFAERCMGDTSLGFPEQIVLMYLTGNDGSNQEQIVRFFELDKGAIAKTVAKLEAKGLVVSRINENNRREKTLSLTPEAQRILEHMREALTIWQDRVFQGIDPESKRITEESVARMAKNSHLMIEGKN